MASVLDVEIKDPTEVIISLEKVLVSKENPVRGKLWIAWHYLQVYSTWGLRIQSSQNDLKLYLNIEDPSSYPFFGTMLEAYQKIYESSMDFQSHIFPKVIKLGSSLKKFAQNNRDPEDSIWSAVVEMLDDADSQPDILELIEDLQKKATKNQEEADQVTILLSGYSANLEIASGKLKSAGYKVDKDKRTSKDRITELQNGPEVMGSLKQIQQFADTQSKAYQENKVIAATSITYAWVPVIGGIAAAIVAGIFGDAAVKALKNYNEAMKRFTASNAELDTALKAHEVQGLAKMGIVNSKKHTDRAIQNVTVVKNTWSALSESLSTIKDKVKDMTKTTDQDIILKRKEVVRLYANQASKAWDRVWPAIKELTVDPYIKMEIESKSIDQLISELELELAA